MTAPAVPAPPAWHRFATFACELGTNAAWAGSGSTWGQSRWGHRPMGRLLRARLVADVTRLVMSFDYDTGRQGFLDPGDVGTATATLYDPDGELGLAEGRSLGALVRAWARTAAGERLVFWGKVIESGYVGDLAAPALTVRAVDPLGVALAGPVLYVIPFETVAARLHRLLDDTLWPRYLRDIEDDPTPLVGVNQPGARLDEARRAVESAGGTMWADGSVIRYRGRDVALAPNVPPALVISTDQPGPGASPSSVGTAESFVDVLNGIYLEADGGRFRMALVDATSAAHYGPRAYRRTDLLNATEGSLNTIAERLALHAWPRERLDPLSVVVHEERSAAAVLVTLGDVVDVTYTGSAPARYRQVTGGVAHHVTPDEWAVTLRLFDALPGPGAFDPIAAVPWLAAYWADGPRPASPSATW